MVHGRPCPIKLVRHESRHSLSLCSAQKDLENSWEHPGRAVLAADTECSRLVRSRANRCKGDLQAGSPVVVLTCPANLRRRVCPPTGQMAAKIESSWSPHAELVRRKLAVRSPKICGAAAQVENLNPDFREV